MLDSPFLHIIQNSWQPLRGLSHSVINFDLCRDQIPPLTIRHPLIKMRAKPQKFIFHIKILTFGTLSQARITMSATDGQPLPKFQIDSWAESIATKLVSSRQTNVLGVQWGGKGRLRKWTLALPSAFVTDGKIVEREFVTYSKLLVHKHVLVGCTSNYSAHLELLPQLPITIGQANWNC